MKRRISILGSTGSIGKQALQVIALHPESFTVSALIANSSAEQLFAQAREFRPRVAGLSAGEVPIPDDLRDIEWVFGDAALRAGAESAEADDVLVSVVGVCGLPATLAALKSGKRVLLANKETLVAGGALVEQVIKETGGSLLPVDSEHSAIFQCLNAAEGNPMSRIYLTASGGPFRLWCKEDIDRATPASALRHPNWNMGAKVTIDSASMFNKALEVVEARWLFSAKPSQIHPLVHPQSVVHSMVEFEDGAVIAQLGVPDMRLPILYALSYPKRMATGAPRLDFSKYSALIFEEPDYEKFPALSLAFETLEAGGAAAAEMNAADEIAVAAFLNEKLLFGDIYRVIRAVLDDLGALPLLDIDDLAEADARARRSAETHIKRLGLRR
ncbi:MAG: 1-deoxy-D-xylulose-5-phosphate reductoisomerase [Eubacteriales bacterium]|nr:1-deoxy-D-xylulose-5-phosphate reductoisomerase [Eubacteriales bacterium]MDD3881338.1 1-deoxy-D-xylulose-5-phosphate reductoisomerase [Eubacteriales bacterium]MDD4513665.1 1-deoxy-D-xylulose-5-phosphate reductoisomerase [Eubacteriales bacterium]